jgi:hypothetical protein
MTKILSPNIVLTESDLTRVRREQPNNPYLVVGNTPRANYFVPVSISQMNDYNAIFGGISDNEYTGLTVNDLLNGDAESVTVLPVANVAGYTSPFVLSINTSTGSVSRTVAELHLTKGGKTAVVTSASVQAGSTLQNFTISLFSASVEVPQFKITSASVYESDTNFIGNLSNPESESQGVYTRYYVSAENAFQGTGESVVASNPVTITTASNRAYPSYKDGSTPWVLSQAFGTGNYYRLFRFHTLVQGDSVNRQYRIAIENMKTPSEVSTNSQYGRFDVVVRDYKTGNELERFSDVNFDPTSNNFVGRAIGDTRVYFDVSANQVQQTGLYPNNSGYIRIELGNIKDIPNSAFPFGFERYELSGNFFGSGSNGLYVYPAVGQEIEAGVDFTNTFVDYIHRELPTTTVAGVASERFFLDTVFGDYISEIPVEDRNLNFGFVGATDGFDPTVTRNIGLDMDVDNTFGFDFTNTSASGYVSYKRAIDILSDYEYVEFELGVLAGLNFNKHANVISYALNMAKARGDVGFILDAGMPNQNATQIVSNLTGIDSSYGIAYAGHYNIGVQGLGTLTVPPSVIVPTAFAYTDRVTAPWYATSGYNRGILEGLTNPYRRISVRDRDILFAGRVNSVVSIVGESNATILGNRSLFVDPDNQNPLSFFNVRRLLNNAKKRIRFEAKRFLEEPFNDQTVSELRGILSTYFQSVQNRNGLLEFRIAFQNTAEDQDGDILRGVIYLRPTKSLRGIVINLALFNTGTVEFSE